MWKVEVLGHHRSTKAVILSTRDPEESLQTNCVDDVPDSVVTIGGCLENFELRLRQVMDPRSYTEQNHGLIYDSKYVYIVWIKCMYIG